MEQWAPKNLDIWLFWVEPTVRRLFSIYVELRELESIPLGIFVNYNGFCTILSNKWSNLILHNFHC
jgi:hypothetical protein